MSETLTRIGPFELAERLGVGGMGVVYRAIFVQNGTPVALKILAADVAKGGLVFHRFEREISILKKLEHPHIVRYYGGGRVGGSRFYAMELVPGGSLETLIKERRKLPWQDAIELALQITSALEHAHAVGVIHRDLKPGNLLITRRGKLKLTDFGIARDTSAAAITAAGRTVGTYAYMAPEQIRGKPPVSPQTDLYALGCVLFEMLTGRTPFQNENHGELLLMHLREPAPKVSQFVPDCPIWLVDLVSALLEKAPSDRPADARAVQESLTEIRDFLTLQALYQETNADGPTVVDQPTRSETEGMTPESTGSDSASLPVIGDAVMQEGRSPLETQAPPALEDRPTLTAESLVLPLPSRTESSTRAEPLVEDRPVDRVALSPRVAAAPSSRPRAPRPVRKKVRPLPLYRREWFQALMLLVLLVVAVGVIVMLLNMGVIPREASERGAILGQGAEQVCTLVDSVSGWS